MTEVSSRILLLDTATEHPGGVFLPTVRSCLLEYVHLAAVLDVVCSSGLAVFGQEEKILVPLQPFRPTIFHKAVHQIPEIEDVGSTPDVGGQVSRALDFALRSFQEQGSQRRVVTLMTCRLLKPHEELQNVLQSLLEAFVHVELVYVAPRTQEDASITACSSRTELGFLTQFENVSIALPSGDPLSLGRLMKAWLRESPTKQVYLVLSNRMRLECSLETECLADMAWMRSMVCSCHHLPINDKRAMHYCSATKLRLSSLDILNMGQTGSLCLPEQAESEVILSFTALRRVHLDSIPETLVYGRPYILRSSADCGSDLLSLERNEQCLAALCVTLARQDEGLLVTCTGDPDTGFSCDGLVHLGLLLAAEEESTLLFKRLASREQILPRDQKKGAVSIPQGVQEEIDALLGQMSLVPYTPFDYSSGLHNAATHAFTRQPPVPVHQQEIRTRGVRPRAYPSKFQRIEII